MTFFRTSFLLLFLLTSGAPVLAETLVFNAPTGGDFKVKSVAPAVVDTKAFRGRPLLVVFGFTRCKSICPLTLGRLKSYYESLNTDNSEKPQVLFVSVDTVRDKAQDVDSYVRAFNADFIGAVETDANLKKILESFGARFYRYKTASGNLLVDHTSDIYVINSKGVWADAIGFDSTPNEIANAVSKAETVVSVQDRFPKSVTARLVTKKSCDLNKGACEFFFNKNKIRVELSSKRIQLQTPFKVFVKISSSENMPVPQFVDLQGLELNMGLLRPKLLQVGADLYSAEVTLPFCELKKMNWVMTLILNYKGEKNIAGKFNFVSREL